MALRVTRPVALGVIFLLTTCPAPTASAEEYSISIGDPAAGDIGGAGEWDSYSFTASTGQSVYVQRTASSNATGLNWRLEDRFGRLIGGDCTALNDLGPASPIGGAYTLKVFGEVAKTGTYEFALHDATPRESAIAVDNVISGTLEKPGRRHSYSFAAGAGKTIAVDWISTTDVWHLNWILDDDHGRQVQPRTGNLLDIGPFTLVGGTHTLTVLGESAATGSYEFRIASVSNATEEPTAVALGEVVSGIRAT